jgi:hypothetical protein
MMARLSKSDRIEGLVATLRREFGLQIQVHDEWSIDRHAIGFVRPGVSRVFYCSTWNQEHGRVYYSCEVPDADSSLTIDEGVVEETQLAAKVRECLEIQPQP